MLYLNVYFTYSWLLDVIGKTCFTITTYMILSLTCKVILHAVILILSVRMQQGASVVNYQLITDIRSYR